MPPKQPSNFPPASDQGLQSTQSHNVVPVDRPATIGGVLVMLQFFDFIGGRRALVAASALNGLVTSLLFVVEASPTVAAQPPNVVVVITDDQGYGEFSCHGNPVPSPNIDRLASQSLRLVDFHVAPMCTPTRGQLMTGLDSFRNAACNVSSGRSLLRADLKTMADEFRAAGYRTGMFGKWHLGDNYPYRPHDRGFDESVWFPSSHIGAASDYWENDYFDDTYLRNGEWKKYSGYATDVFFSETMRWIGETSEPPFFAYLALNAAHGPWYVPDDYRQPVRKILKDHPELTSDMQPEERERLVSFLAMGVNIDDNIGRLDKFLADSNLLDNTILVFLTDNGSTFGPRYFNAGMRGGKTTLWEGGHRVPCFIRWPAGELGEPREITELTHVQDLLPTLLELAGSSPSANGLDGVSIVPLFRGEEMPLDDRMLIINYSRMPGMKVGYTDQNVAIPQKDGAVVLWKRWRLVENRELYDLATDPMQERNVAAEHPEVVQKLRAHLDAWWEGVSPHVAQPQRVVVGSQQENPSRLVASEWLDVFVDQQAQIRRGVPRNGVWHITVDRPGTYTVEVSRFPPESGLSLNDKVARTRVTDGVLTPGRAFAVTKARVKVGDQTQDVDVVAGDKSAKFELKLEAGDTTLETWLLAADGQEIAGAYYAIVTWHY
jgi:arylsulfatase A-like enzyme